MQLFTSILLINDSSFQRGLIRGYLEADGFIVIEASDGIEGLSKAKEEQLDLVISDMEMPGLDGVTFLDALREQADQTPVIILSADEQLLRRDEACQHGAIAFLSKPIDRDDLYREVMAVLGEQDSPTKVN